jgi:hypothetical protein
MIPFPPNKDYLLDILKVEIKNFEYISNIKNVEIYKKDIGNYIYIIATNNGNIVSLFELLKSTNNLVLVNEKRFSQSDISVNEIADILNNDIKIQEFLTFDKQQNL